MTVTLIDPQFSIAPRHSRVGSDQAGIATQPQRPSLVDLIALTWHEVNDLMRSLRGELTGVGIRDTEHMAGIFNDGDLHTKADAEVRNVVFPRILSGQNHAFDTTVTKSTGNDDAVKATKDSVFRFFCNGLGVNPLDVYFRVKGISCMAQGFRNRQVGIMELHIFTHKPDGHRLAAVFDGRNHSLPFAQIWFRGRQMKLSADNGGKLCFL